MNTVAKKYVFTDVQFMNAKEKERVNKQWVTFLNSNCSRAKFTKALYNHLHLHCGFIAHYNIYGFYDTYFSDDYDDLARFFSHLERYTPMADYSDINDAMIQEYCKQKDRITQRAQATNDDRFKMLQEAVKRAETDMDFRNDLLNKLLSN